MSDEGVCRTALATPGLLIIKNITITLLTILQTILLIVNLPGNIVSNNNDFSGPGPTSKVPIATYIINQLL